METTVSEKLDFLMKLTNTSNAALGRALSFDASYISRIRSGKRGLPPEQPFIGPAAAYFARHITEEYQKRSACEAVALRRFWPENTAECAMLLEAWLLGEEPAQDPLERMTAAMTMSGGEPVRSADGGRLAEAVLFYGNSGERDAVIAFLTEICRSGKGCTLLLYSDEELSWLYEDDAFARQWAALLKELVRLGGRIRIIHAVDRNGNEMWEAVRKWLPLYMTGAIEPYYYPGLRDGAYHRTLFVAEDHSAITGQSVRGQEGETLYLLLHDRTAVSALEQEFAAYLAMCRPLMEIAHLKDRSALAQLLRAFLRAPGIPLAAVAGDMVLCVKESAGVLVCKGAPPYVAFRMQEFRMKDAVKAYLESLPAAARQEGEQAAALLEEQAAAWEKEPQ